MEHESRRPASTLTSYFKGVLSLQKREDPTRDIVELLTIDRLDPIVLNEILAREAIAKGGQFRNQALDLVLNYIRHVLADRAISDLERKDVRLLRQVLEVEDGELMDSRRADLATLLGQQLDRVLDDRVIDDPEELFEVELQAAFGLGYDDYLTLIRPSVERVFAELTSLPGDSIGARPEDVERKLSLLKPLYLLAIAARATP